MLETVLMIFFTILAICILTNISYIQPVYIKLGNKAKITIRILLVLIIIILIVNKYLDNKTDDAAEKKIQKEIQIEQERLAKNSNEEKIFYDSIVNKEYEEQKPQEPYIPEGFEHIEGEWDTGFVIKDKENNQYVWVPCINNENNENIPKLQKKDFIKNPWISINECYDTEYRNFLQSAFKYGGFYIGRFELCKSENNELIIAGQKEIWINMKKTEVEDEIVKMNQKYHSDTIKIQLMNSYAYDTTIEWIDKNNGIEFIKSNKAEDGKKYSGQNQTNNIFDLFDTTYEMTTELFCDENSIYRGNCNTLLGKAGEEDSRVSLDISIVNPQKTQTSARTILYKK